VCLCSFVVSDEIQVLEYVHVDTYVHTYVCTHVCTHVCMCTVLYSPGYSSTTNMQDIHRVCPIRKVNVTCTSSGVAIPFACVKLQ
jgi:hypothetical protein